MIGSGGGTGGAEDVPGAGATLAFGKTPANAGATSAGTTTGRVGRFPRRVVSASADLSLLSASSAPSSWPSAPGLVDDASSSDAAEAAAGALPATSSLARFQSELNRPGRGLGAGFGGADSPSASGVDGRWRVGEPVLSTARRLSPFSASLESCFLAGGGIRVGDGDERERVRTWPFDIWLGSGTGVSGSSVASDPDDSDAGGGGVLGARFRPSLRARAILSTGGVEWVGCSGLVLGVPSARSRREVAAVVGGSLPLPCPPESQRLSTPSCFRTPLGEEVVDDSGGGGEVLAVFLFAGAAAAAAGGATNMPGRTRPPGWTRRRSGCRPNAPAFMSA